MVLYKISSIRTHTMILFSRPQTIVANVFGQMKKKKKDTFSHYLPWESSQAKVEKGKVRRDSKEHMNWEDRAENSKRKMWLEITTQISVRADIHKELCISE